MLALFSLAEAAPVFAADSPGLAALASRAWTHATACAGREAPAADVVTLTIGGVGGGFEGRAFVAGPRRTVWRDAAGNVVRTEETSPGGLYEIRFAKDKPKPSTVAHEVAHAWVHGGDAPALREGATDLLAACIAARDPARFPPEPPVSTDLGELVDLRAWDNPDDAPSGERSAGYEAARRMVFALAEAVPRERLWRANWTWDDFDAVLDEAGEVGTLLRGALSGGADAQRVLLGDPDEDGAITLAEHVAGTDPTRWDTDGDGWWDGAPAALREEAVPLPPGGRPVCSGRAAGPLGAVIHVRGGIVGIGGRVRGDRSRAPHVVIDGVRPKDQSTPMYLERGASIALDPRSEAGGWGVVEGTGLVKDRRCGSAAGWTLLGSRGAEDAVVALAAALQRVAPRADGILGPDRTPRYLWVGEPFPRVLSMQARFVPGGWLDRGATGEWDYVAAFLVARERLPGTALLGDVPGEVALFEAFARTLVDRAPEVLLDAVDDEEVADWATRAGACPGGWAALLAGRCGRLDHPDERAIERDEPSAPLVPPPR